MRRSSGAGLTRHICVAPRADVRPPDRARTRPHPPHRRQPTLRADRPRPTDRRFCTKTTTQASSAPRSPSSTRRSLPARLLAHAPSRMRVRALPARGRAETRLGSHHTPSRAEPSKRRARLPTASRNPGLRLPSVARPKRAPLLSCRRVPRRRTAGPTPAENTHLSDGCVALIARSSDARRHYDATTHRQRSQ